MSRNDAARDRRPEQYAPVFAALGDPTRLSLVSKLLGGKPHSIAQLTEGTRVTRQAITKHLRVLEDVGVVHSVKRGRENLYALDPKPIEGLREYLSVVASQWERALADLKDFVET